MRAYDEVHSDIRIHLCIYPKFRDVESVPRITGSRTIDKENRSSSSPNCFQKVSSSPDEKVAARRVKTSFYLHPRGSSCQPRLLFSDRIDLPLSEAKTWTQFCNEQEPINRKKRTIRESPGNVMLFLSFSKSDITCFIQISLVRDILQDNKKYRSSCGYIQKIVAKMYNNTNCIISHKIVRMIISYQFFLC